MARLQVCALIAVSATGTAAAEHARYPRQQSVPIAVELSARVRPIPPPPPVSAATTPSIDADVVLSIEALRTPVRAEQEQILAALIQNTPDSEVEEKSDYYFRLGELYAKQHRLWRIKHSELAGNPQHAAQAANEAKNYLLKTVKAFKGLTDNEAFRNYPKLDVALFYYAYTLQSGKYLKEARAVYDKLLKNFPTSRYVPEAHAAFGDYYFAAGQLADAEARYKEVAKYPKAAVYPYALYRLGWVNMQLQRFQEALEQFHRVVVATRNEPKQAELAQAARADFVRAYAHVGKPDRALDTLMKIDKTKATELVEILASETNAADRGSSVYRELLARAPGDARACHWQYRVANATLATAGATTAAKVNEIDALVKITASMKQVDAECRANASAMSSEVAALLHAEWATTRDADTLGHAERLYASHVATFPDSVAREAYAEVLWSRADQEANARLRSSMWQRSAEMFATSQSPDAMRASALAWMNALDVAIPVSPKITLARAQRQRRLPMKDRDSRLVAAATGYVATADATDPTLAQIRLAAAITLRRYRHFDEAVVLLDAFLEHHQTHASAELAANLLLDSMLQSSKPTDVLDVVDAIASDHGFVAGKPELQKNLQLIRSRLAR